MANQNPPLKTENRQPTRLVPASDESEARFARQPRDVDDETAEATAAERGSVAEGASVNGRWLLAIPDAVTTVSGSFRAFTEQQLTAAGLDELRRDAWYARAELLTALARLEDTVGVQIIERVGRFLPALLDSPADTTTLRGALAAFDEWYGLWHRESSDTVAFTTPGPTTAVLRFATPYPEQFERGLVRGFIYEFGADGEYARLSSQESEADGTTRYEITFLRSDPGTN